MGGRAVPTQEHVGNVRRLAGIRRDRLRRAPRGQGVLVLKGEGRASSIPDT